MSAPSWAVGMRRIGPGLYVDGKGDLHVNAYEICRALGKPATPENLRNAELGAIDACRENFPDVKVSEVE